MRLREVRLVAAVDVPFPVEPVWAFVSRPEHSPLWDRSVARIEATGAAPLGVGWEGRTTAPSGRQQTFRVCEWEPPARFSFELLDRDLFDRARLGFRFEAVPGGTRVVHELDLRVRRLWLVPVIRLTQRRALASDLAALADAIRVRLGPAAAA